MDYEKVLMNTLHKQFPQASLYGYWFHYCQVNKSFFNVKQISYQSIFCPPIFCQFVRLFIKLY